MILTWYYNLLISLLVGPIFSLTGLDNFLHKLILTNGGGRTLVNRNEFTKNFNSIIVGVPFWIAISSILLQPFWGGGFPWQYTLLLFIGGLLKLAYGRSYINEQSIESSSKAWVPCWKRAPFDFTDELSGIFTRFAYPSVHTLAILGAVLFGVHSPVAWVLFGITVLWLVLVNHHWVSDVFSGVFLTFAVYQLLY